MSTAQIYQACQEDVSFFAWFFFPHHVRIENGVPECHKQFYEAYADQSNTRIIFQAPRGSAKTTLGTLIIPACATLFQRLKFGLIASESFSLAAIFLDTFRKELEENERVRHYFGNVCPIKGYASAGSRKWTEGDIITSSGIRWVARGTGQRVRGLKFMNERPKLVVVDDPESGDNTKTPESIEQNNRWLSREVLPALSDDGRILVLGNAVAPGCITHRLSENTEWTCIKTPAILADGTSYWPERFPIERLESIRREYEQKGDFDAFEVEYQNNVVSKVTQKLNPENYRYWRGTHLITITGNYLNISEVGRPVPGSAMIEYRNPVAHRVPVDFYLGGDFAISEKQKSDFSVGFVIARDAEGNVYEIEKDRFKTAQIDEIAERMVMLAKKYQVKRCGFEKNGFQVAIAQTFNKLLVKYGVDAPVELYDNKEEKSIRLMRTYQPYVNASMLYLIESDTETRRELEAIPNGMHDDIADAGEMAIRCSRPCEFAGVHDFYTRPDRSQVSEETWLTL